MHNFIQDISFEFRFFFFWYFWYFFAKKKNDKNKLCYFQYNKLFTARVTHFFDTRKINVCPNNTFSFLHSNYSRNNLDLFFQLKSSCVNEIFYREIKSEEFLIKIKVFQWCFGKSKKGSTRKININKKVYYTIKLLLMFYFSWFVG